MAIAVRSGEFPSGYTLNAMLDVKNIQRQSILHLACADGVGKRANLQIGEQASGWSLQQLSPDQLFLAFDTSGLPAGCALEAAIDNGAGGASQPVALARILRMPQIDSFVAATPVSQNGTQQQYLLTGQDLEMIQKVGWDDHSGLDVSGLPTPLAGQGLKQSIQIALPNPPVPDALLYVWLRGDEQGRETTIKAPPSSALLPPPSDPAAPPQ
jgi:hypothetical protein